ncbi:hypothetical protein BSLG_001842 [Batrachochytrium salamandrivorans]|nr:hypothetical protein BASA81_002856 [Batrachochytrium salamandrivorans]KAJ1343573.1 hypothetical protein BSLG_001842 [Batrachochytrium salamandrivorans]
MKFPPNPPATASMQIGLPFDPTASLSNEILVFGLNPAFQATLHFEHYQFGKVNRAFRKCNSVGGKGQNFAIACGLYGDGDKLTVMQIVGGMTGRYIQAFLDERKIQHISINTRKATRTCTTILDERTGEMTQLIEPAARVDSTESNQLEQSIRYVIENSPKIEAIALCGTLPPGLTGYIYTLIAQLKPPNVLLLLDAYQNTECLRTGHVDILKINAEEARLLALVDVDADLFETGKKLHEMYKVTMIAVTNGPDQAYLFHVTSRSSDGAPLTLTVTSYIIPPVLTVFSEMGDLESVCSSPRSRTLPEATGEPTGLHTALKTCHISGSSFTSYIENGDSMRSGNGSDMGTRDGYKDVVINPLGAGDTCSSIFVVEYLDTLDAADAFRHGLAAASASCLVVDYTSYFDMGVKTAIYDRIVPSSTIVHMVTAVE